MEKLMNTKFIVIVNRSYHVEGDERSKTNPGHGYPAHDVKYLEAIEFETEVALKGWIEKEEKRSQYSKKVYRIFKASELQIETKLDVKLQEK